MSVSSFAVRDVPTRLGVVRLRVGRSAPAWKPVVVGIAGTLSAHSELTQLLGQLSIFGDPCIAYLPGAGGLPLMSFALADISAALAEAIEITFPGRPVVLLGVSIGAVVALGIRAINVARVIAVEPPLVTAKLWPVLGALQVHLKSHPGGDGAALVWEAFGVSETRIEDRDHRNVLQHVNRPVDVVLGEMPLSPQRQLPRFPSLVGDEERQLLGSTRGVQLHLVRGAGHNVLGQAPIAVRDVLLEACRRASAPDALTRGFLDEPLLEATPAMARRVLYWGEGGAPFRAAFLAAGPKAEVILASPGAKNDAGDGFDAVVASAEPSDDALAVLTARLAEGGHLIARWAADPREIASRLAPHGLTLREPIDDGGPAIARAQKISTGFKPARPLTVQTAALAQLLMDIRTRLPNRGLRSDPELHVVYTSAPLKLLPLGRDEPKVLILQRPAAAGVDHWRSLLANAMNAGWLVIIEFDDHPELVRKVKGLPATGEEMRWLSYAHAVQTTTPPLVEAFSAYNPEVAMFPNSAFELLPFPEGPRPPKVVYSGVIRGPHAVGVAASLRPAVEACPEVEFHVIGDRAVLDALPTQNKVYYDYMSYEAYLDVMASCAISLSPIVPEPMRDTKSDAKFLDAARAGGLTIASPTIYDRVIEHGVNGLLAPETGDWAPLLTLALTDQARRAEMAQNAWAYVRERRMFSDQIVQRRSWYRDLWSRRRELDEALIARVPGLADLIKP